MTTTNVIQFDPAAVRSGRLELDDTKWAWRLHCGWFEWVLTFGPRSLWVLRCGPSRMFLLEMNVRLWP